VQILYVALALFMNLRDFCGIRISKLQNHHGGYCYKGYPHLCIRNITEAQTPTLIGTAAEGESCFTAVIDLAGEPAR
jgi:hypothetical protein